MMSPSPPPSQNAPFSKRAVFHAVRKGESTKLAAYFGSGAALTPTSLWASSLWNRAARETTYEKLPDVFRILHAYTASSTRLPKSTYTLHPYNALEARPTQGQTYQKARALWSLWFLLDPSERASLLLLEDNNMHTLRSLVSGPYKSTAKEDKDIFDKGSLWHHDPMKTMCFKLKTTIQAYYHAPRHKAPPLPLLAPSCASSASLGWEEIVLLLQNLYTCSTTNIPTLTYNEDWGSLGVTAPRALLASCLSHPTLRSLLCAEIERAALLFKRELAHPPPVLDVCLTTCVALVKRLHVAGLTWPHAWPPSTRQALQELPLVHTFWEKRTLTRALSSSYSLNTKTRPRV